MTILLILAGAVVLCVVLAGSAFLLLRGRFRSNPVYQESLEMARSAPEIQRLLGQPIQEGWATFVETRHVYGSDFAEWTASINGPKGRGSLQGVANRIGPSWHYSRLVFTMEGNPKTVDLSPPPTPDKLLLRESKKKVFLVPLGSVSQEDLNWAPGYYRAKFSLRVDVLPAIPLQAFAWDAKRRQLVAEKLIALMKQSLPQDVTDQSTTLIGITTGTCTSKASTGIMRSITVKTGAMP